MNVSATDAGTDHSTHTHFLATSTGAASGVTRKDMVKAAIRPYSDVKYCTVQEIGAICQCEKKFIKRGPRERQGEKPIGARKTINSRSGKLCYCGQRDASPITVQVEKRKDKTNESNSFVPWMP